MATEVLDAKADSAAIGSAIDTFAAGVTSIDEASVEIEKIGRNRVVIYLSYTP